MIRTASAKFFKRAGVFDCSWMMQSHLGGFDNCRSTDDRAEAMLNLLRTRELYG